MTVPEVTRTVRQSPVFAKINPFEMMLQQLDLVREQTEIYSNIWKIICRPERELEVSVPVTRDDGTVEVFTGYRVQYNSERGK